MSTGHIYFWSIPSLNPLTHNIWRLDTFWIDLIEVTFYSFMCWFCVMFYLKQYFTKYVTMLKITVKIFVRNLWSKKIINYITSFTCTRFNTIYVDSFQKISCHPYNLSMGWDFLVGNTHNNLRHSRKYFNLI